MEAVCQKMRDLSKLSDMQAVCACVCNVMCTLRVHVIMVCAYVCKCVLVVCACVGSCVHAYASLMHVSLFMCVCICLAIVCTHKCVCIDVGFSFQKQVVSVRCIPYDWYVFLLNITYNTASF